MIIVFVLFTVLAILLSRKPRTPNKNTTTPAPPAPPQVQPPIDNSGDDNKYPPNPVVNQTPPKSDTTNSPNLSWIAGVVFGVLGVLGLVGAGVYHRRKSLKGRDAASTSIADTGPPIGEVMNTNTGPIKEVIEEKETTMMDTVGGVLGEFGGALGEVVRDVFRPLSQELYVPTLEGFRELKWPGVRQAAAEGNCLFDSIAMLLNHHEGGEGGKHTHMEVRRNAVNWLRNNLDFKLRKFGDITVREWIKLLTNETVEQYLRRMEDFGQIVEAEYGQAPTVLGAAMHYGVRINAHMPGMKDLHPEAIFNERTTNPKHVLNLLLHGQHYTPYVREHEYRNMFNHAVHYTNEGIEEMKEKAIEAFRTR